MAKIENPLTVVQQGGGDFEYAGNFTSLYQAFYVLGNSYVAPASLPETVDLSLFTNVTQIDEMAARYAQYIVPRPSAKHYIFHLVKPVACTGAFKHNDIVESVTFIDGIVMRNHSYVMFYKCTSLKSVFGKITPSNFWNTGGSSSFSLTGCTSLEDIEFEYNCSGNFNVFCGDSPNLTNASIISIANNLEESITGRTVTFHATVKAKCSTIMGTVALDPTSTFHIFTANPSGTTSLEEFITVTKGWTLA